MENTNQINWAKDFTSIKEGEYVLIKKGVYWGFRQQKLFYIPKKVDRVTKTQFIIEGIKFYKKSGSKIGDPWERTFINGQNTGYGNTAKSQETEYIVFKERINSEELIRSKLLALNFQLNTSIEIKDLKNFITVLEDIKTKLDK